MKKLILFLRNRGLIPFAILFLSVSNHIFSQTCEVTLRNDSLIDANNLIVDIYVRSTSGTFYYSSGQYKVTYNKASILNGGTITGSIVPGYSDLTNPAQVPNAVNTDFSTYWRVLARLNPETQAECSQISASGNGTRICRVKLTNSAAFGAATADNLLSVTNPATSIWYAESDGSATPATITIINTNLVNPILNGALTLYTVTGGGTTPASVGLDGSQAPGVNYALYKNSVQQGSTINGTGSTLSFGSQTEGTYTVKAHRKATYMYANMTGSAVVTSVAPKPFNVTGGGSYCQGKPGLPVGLDDSETGVTYTLYKNAVPQTPTVAGTGNPISFGNQLNGLYTVYGTNSGGTVQMNGSATITENDLPVVLFTGTLASQCVSSTTYALSGGSPAGGAYSGPGVSGTNFNASAAGAGTHTITYTYTDGNGCTNSATNTIRVYALPTVTFTGTLVSQCVNSTSYTLSGGSPAGGTYSGPGVIGANFNASLAGAGTHTITYTYTNGNGCTNSATNSITVYSLPAVTFTGTLTSQCVSSITYTLSGGLPGGGAYSGPGVSGTNFNASAAGAGTHTITYTYTDGHGCSNSATNSITVYSLPAVTFTGSLASQCVSSTTYALSGGSPAGGAYSGPGVSGTNFNASAAGAGTHTITYTYTDGNGCTNSATNTIRVYALPTVTFTGTLVSQCVNSTSYTLSGGSPAGGAYSGTGVSGTNFNASIAGAGTHTITYTYTDGNGCSNSATNSITVYSLPTVTFTGTLTSQCVSSTTYTLSGGSPAGGAYSGPGVSGTNFNASLAGAGTHTITYTYTDGHGCSNSATNSITVYSLPTVTFTGTLASQCVSSTTYALSGGSPAGGVYSGPGVSGTNFNASAAGAGTHTITYTYTNGNGCTSSATNNIVVYSLPVVTLASSDIDNIICSGTQVTFTASGGIYYNFRLSGASVQNGTSNTYVTSSLANGHVVDVVVTASSGCQATSAAITNFVNPLPFIIVTTPPSCSPDLLTYSLGVTVSAGTVTSTAGSVSNTGGNTWAVSSVPKGTSIIITATDITGCASSLPVTAPNCLCPGILAPVSGGDKSYCAYDPVPSISVSVLTGETADWYSAPSGGTPLLSGSLTYSPATAGTYYASARNISSNCESSTRTPVAVTMYSTPVATLVSSDTDNRFCPGTTVVFTAGGGVSFNFRVDGISVQNGSSNSYTTSLLTNGQVVDVIVTNANGCSATSQPVTNTVFTLPVATLSSSDNDNTFCAGSTVIFTAGGGVNYTFRLAGTTVQNGPSVTYTTSSVANGQVVDVIVTNSSGCSALSTGITNLVNPLPTPSITSSDQDNTFCTGATITFTASGGNNYIFRVGGVTVQNSASTSYATDALADGQVVDVVVSDINNCQVISPGITNHVILHHVPDVSAGQDTSICIGGSAQLKATGDGTFSWLPVTDLSDPLIDNPVTGTDTTITYTVTLTDQYGCQNSDEVKVTVLEPPVTFAGDDMVLEYIFTVQLEASPLKDGETGQWSVDSGSGEFSDPDGANSTVSGMHLGENILLWTVTNHVCPSAADYIRIVVNDLIVPTLITPNGDPFNEYFMLRGIETLGLTELTIFDRRGAMVYRNRAYDNSWNGVDHNGNPLPDDTYFYVIKSQNGKSLSGYIVIRR